MTREQWLALGHGHRADEDPNKCFCGSAYDPESGISSTGTKRCSHRLAGPHEGDFCKEQTRARPRDGKRYCTAPLSACGWNEDGGF